MFVLDRSITNLADRDRGEQNGTLHRQLRFDNMSCGNGCGCCSKCGCHATCTCNQSMTFDENMDDFSRNSVILVAGEMGKPGSHYAGYPAGTCTNESSFSTRFFSSCENGAHGE